MLVKKIDFVRLDAENRALGQRGEELAFELEQRRLHDELGRPDLAREVRWVARDEGDGLGYDIHSFEGGGEDRLIEVKTTGQGKYFPFAVTRNELTVSQREATRTTSIASSTSVSRQGSTSLAARSTRAARCRRRSSERQSARLRPTDGVTQESSR